MSASSHPRLLLTLPIACIAFAFAAPAEANQKRFSAKKASGVPCANQDLLPNRTNLRQIRVATICLLNIERSRHGLHPVRSQGSLRAVATSYARKLVRQQFFSHVAPDGTTFEDRIRRSVYTRKASSWSAGENLAWGTGTLASPRSIVRSWMHSPGHRHNVLRPVFRDIGIGVVPATPVADGGTSRAGTYVTVYGRHRVR